MIFAKDIEHKHIGLVVTFKEKSIMLKHYTMYEMGVFLYGDPVIGDQPIFIARLDDYLEV